MEYMTALGSCPKCGQDKIQVEGVIKCLSCDSENNVGSGLVVRIDDPGHDAIDKLLARVGVAEAQGGKPPEPIKPHFEAKALRSDVPRAQFIPVSEVSGIDQAIAILRALPMPKDLKQFKQINKAIKILEQLGA